MATGHHYLGRSLDVPPECSDSRIWQSIPIYFTSSSRWHQEGHCEHEAKPCEEGWHSEQPTGKRSLCVAGEPCLQQFCERTHGMDRPHDVGMEVCFQALSICPVKLSLS